VPRDEWEGELDREVVCFVKEDPEIGKREFRDRKKRRRNRTKKITCGEKGGGDHTEGSKKEEVARRGRGKTLRDIRNKKQTKKRRKSSRKSLSEREEKNREYQIRPGERRDAGRS